MARGGIPMTTIATTRGCSRYTMYKALGQTSVGGRVGHRAIAPREEHHFFYNTFTLSLRSLYDVPHPIRYTLQRPRADTHQARAGDHALPGTIASPSHHKDGSS